MAKDQRVITFQRIPMNSWSRQPKSIEMGTPIAKENHAPCVLDHAPCILDHALCVKNYAPRDADLPYSQRRAPKENGRFAQPKAARNHDLMNLAQREIGRLGLKAYLGEVVKEMSEKLFKISLTR